VRGPCTGRGAAVELTLLRRAGTTSTSTSVPESAPTTTVDKPAATGPDKMASDEDYMAFLDKANEDPSAGYAATAAKSNGKMQLKTMDEGVDVPMELKMATEKEEWIYVSDADEPFVAVSLKLPGNKLPDEGLSALILELRAENL
jgi:hypothetical protein